MTASPFPTPHPEWDPARWRGPRGFLPRALVATARAGWPVLSLPVQAFGPYPASVVRDYGRQSIRSRIWTLWSLLGDPTVGEEVAEAGAVLQRAGVRTLLAHATDDAGVPVSDGERWHGLLPGAERLTLPTGGHQFLLRDRFASIVPFVRGLGVGGHG
jgi:pimeloyl-ACP methyl ester carboxylesterase